MGDLGIREAFSAITSEALLESLMVVLLATGLIIVIQKPTAPHE